MQMQDAGPALAHSDPITNRVRISVQNIPPLPPSGKLTLGGNVEVRLWFVENVLALSNELRFR